MWHEQLKGVALVRGLRVIDMTLFLSGPYATQVLGDLGAEVLKIEPLTGDNTRVLPPNFIGEDSAYYHSCNRNKRSIALDYRTQEGVKLLEELVANSDVFIENLKPGAMARSGITYERLKEINPRLVYCAISGFGQSGPYAERPAYDMVVQAMSGGMSLTGERDGKPVRAGIPLADISAGLYAVIGILAALLRREETGQGEYLDISMLDCQVAMLSYQAAYYLASGKVPGTQGREHESIPSYRAFTARDGMEVVVTANTDRMWHSLCEAIGRTDLRDDPELSGRKARYEHRQRIWDALERAFATRNADEWVQLLVAHDVPVSVVNSLDRVMADPQVRHRDMVLTLQGPAGEQLRVAGNPVKVASRPDQTHMYPPPLGEGTREVLAGLLGKSEAEIERLLAANIVRQWMPASKEVA
ncbi:CaiB/BaiF CoA transferase family protein [Paraburkholderia guartelaensis]|uniref:CaiB/BaiF CoA transferase family protein n=1 Tax=Paraburkholderia guartelaensis TaxID=2546446 RepID=UPI002AB65F38|nr:CoA transferase [Paraburkholderia guartelaensis]